MHFKLNPCARDLLRGEIGIAEQHCRIADQGGNGDIRDHMPEVAVAEGGHLLLQDGKEVGDFRFHRMEFTPIRWWDGQVTVPAESVLAMLQGALQQFAPYLLEETGVFTPGAQEK